MSEDINARINELANEFEQKRFERHQMGEEKYGVGTWIKVDTVEEAKAELLDMGNYLMFTYIKLCLLQEQIVEMLQTQDGPAKPLPGHEMDGKNFIQSKRLVTE